MAYTKRSSFSKMVTIFSLLLLTSIVCGAVNGHTFSASLPSGKCWIDWVFPNGTNTLLCEDIDPPTLAIDLSRLPAPVPNNITFRIYRSTDLRLNSFNCSDMGQIREKVTTLELRNWDAMHVFPDLTACTSLQVLVVSEMGLNTLNVDLNILWRKLPQSLVSLSLWNIHGQLYLSRIATLPNLKYLHIEGMKIHGIDDWFFKKTVPNLKGLHMTKSDFWHSEVTKYKFTVEKPLSSLNISRNTHYLTEKDEGQLFVALSYIDLRNGASVADLSDNFLTITREAIDVMKTTWSGLRGSLVLGGNRFAIDNATGLFEGFAKLELLDVGGMYPGVLPFHEGLFSGLTNVQAIYADSSNLGNQKNADIFRGCSCANLRTLRFRYNELHEVPSEKRLGAIRAQLDSLQLDVNQIELNTKSFEGYSDLQHLSLENGVSHSFYEFNGTMVSALPLRTLNLRCNDFPKKIGKSFFEGMPKLDRLDISRCPVSTVGQIVETNVFESLNVRNLIIDNWWTDSSIFKELSVIPGLQDLSLRGNNVDILNDTKLTFRLGSLLSLDLSGNRLNDIKDFFRLDHFPLLQSLDLSGNNIFNIMSDAFTGLTHLTLLDLSGNQLMQSIGHGAVDQMPSLMVLSLNGNALKAISNILSRPHANLQELYLNDNQITTIYKDDFQYMPSLRKLNLQQRTLNTIEKGAFSQFDNKSFTVALPLNSLTLKCENLWLADYVSGRRFEDFFVNDFSNPYLTNVWVYATHVPSFKGGSFITVPTDLQCGGDVGAATTNFSSLFPLLLIMASVGWHL